MRHVPPDVEKALLRALTAGLRESIKVHGPVTRKWVRSAAKRVAGLLIRNLRQDGVPTDAISPAIASITAKRYLSVEEFKALLPDQPTLIMLRADRHDGRTLYQCRWRKMDVHRFVNQQGMLTLETLGDFPNTYFLCIRHREECWYTEPRTQLSAETPQGPTG